VSADATKAVRGLLLAMVRRWGVLHLRGARDYALDALSSDDPQRLIFALSVCKGFERKAEMLSQSRRQATEALRPRRAGGKLAGAVRRLRAEEEWRPRVERYHELRAKGLTPAQAKEQVCIEIWGNAQRPDPKTIARWLRN
jgi:hypothetical protein